MIGAVIMKITMSSIITSIRLTTLIFMITAPIMQGGVDVKLPTAEASRSTRRAGWSSR